MLTSSYIFTSHTFKPSYLYIPTNIFFVCALYIYIFFLADIFILYFPLSYTSRYTSLRSRAIRRLVLYIMFVGFICLNKRHAGEIRETGKQEKQTAEIQRSKEAGEKQKPWQIGGSSGFPKKSYSHMNRHKNNKSPRNSLEHCATSWYDAAWLLLSGSNMFPPTPTIHVSTAIIAIPFLEIQLQKP